MHVWGLPALRPVRCEEHGVAISAVQAGALVLALLFTLIVNFRWDWRESSPPIDVIVFSQDFAPQPPPKAAKPEPKPKPPPEPEPKREAPPKPEPIVADVGVKPEPEKEEQPPPTPEPEAKPLPEAPPEPEVDDLRNLLEEIDATEQAAPDPELIDIYRQRIKSLIERYLRIPQGTPEDAKVVISVRLTPSGTLDGEPVVESSSGHPDYDSEAVRAVIFAQPYPMPSDPAVLRELRELKLTVRP